MTRWQRLSRWLGQALLYACFAALLAIFSAWPVYHHLGDGEAVITVSIVHQGERLQPCEQRPAEELARLPPTMRVPLRCPRERAPLLLEVDLDGHAVLRRTAAPTGLSGDGSAAIYRRLVVPAGPHRVTARLRDSARTQGFDHVAAADVTLAPAQVLVVDYAAQEREITLR